jgi:hypothetical protein
MNTKLLMISSAVVMGVAGIALSFFPEEMLNYAGANVSVFFPLELQVFGALYFGFAMINWMAKENLIGGIYSRPVALGNFAHFFIGAMALIKFYSANTGMKMILVPAIIYAVFAICFGFVFFGNPLSKKQS